MNFRGDEIKILGNDGTYVTVIHKYRCTVVCAPKVVLSPIPKYILNYTFGGIGSHSNIL